MVRFLMFFDELRFILLVVLNLVLDFVGCCSQIGAIDRPHNILLPRTPSLSFPSISPPFFFLSMASKSSLPPSLPPSLPSLLPQTKTKSARAPAATPTPA